MWQEFIYPTVEKFSNICKLLHSSNKIPLGKLICKLDESSALMEVGNGAWEAALERTQKSLYFFNCIKFSLGIPVLLCISLCLDSLHFQFYNSI